MFEKIDQKIRKKFRLFENNQNAEEDWKRYGSIYSQIFNETFLFLEEELDEVVVENFSQETEKLISDKEFKEEQIPAIVYISVLELLKDKPGLIEKLFLRLDHFVNRLGKS